VPEPADRGGEDYYTAENFGNYIRTLMVITHSVDDDFIMRVGVAMRCNDGGGRKKGATHLSDAARRLRFVILWKMDGSGWLLGS
jgi:hypothetical protein